MGWISKLFGRSKQPMAPAEPPATHYTRSTWELQRQQQAKAAQEDIAPWLRTRLAEKDSIRFTWESGNDEAFVTFLDEDGVQADMIENLEYYIILALDIPDAGEFNMTGSGEIYQENNQARAKYESSIRPIVDYNEEKEEEVYGEAEHDRGDIVLFTL